VHGAGGDFSAEAGWPEWWLRAHRRESPAS
jgi:hypothetical protein